MVRKAVIAGATFLFLACSTICRPDYPEMEPEAACGGLCSVLAENGCGGWLGNPGPDETFGTADDVPCEVQCLESVRLAPWMLDKASCGAASSSCEQVQSCMEEP